MFLNTAQPSARVEWPGVEGPGGKRMDHRKVPRAIPLFTFWIVSARPFAQSTRETRAGTRTNTSISTSTRTEPCHVLPAVADHDFGARERGEGQVRCVGAAVEALDALAPLALCEDQSFRTDFKPPFLPP